MDNVVNLANLFHERVFQIPHYQRGYSWEERQVREFLEDLELLGPGRHHYTGTVVLCESNTCSPRMDEDGNAYVSVDIVDGQQRLTTIVLLLDQIHRSLGCLSEKAQRLASGIEKNYIATQNLNGERLFKLSLNADTDDFFKSSVLRQKPGVAGPQITSQRRLQAAHKRIASYLAANADTEEDEGEEWLRNLYAKVSTQLRFTLYEVDDAAEVGVIFEVMNDRGKPLTDLEKVKNYLLHTSTRLEVPDQHDLAESVNGAWAVILSKLMAAGLGSSDDEDRLLRADWLTHYNPAVKQWKGSKSIKDRFDLRNYKGRHPGLLGELRYYTERLRESSVSFCDVYDPKRHDAFGSFNVDPKTRSEVIEWSERLRRVGVLAPFLPLLIAMRERWPEEPRKYLEVVKLCEAFAFRVYRLKGSRSDAGQFTLFRLGHDLAGRSEDFGGAVLRLKRELAYRSGDEAFKGMMTAEDEQITDAYDWRGLRYFLYEYETALASKQGASPKVGWKELQSRERRDTIEHILPQSIDNRPYWQTRFDERKHKQFLHDLGNLTLTKHNSHYLNKSFPDKKGAVDTEGHCYAKSPLYVERELTLWRDWDTSAIGERREKMLDWARSRWSIDLSNLWHQERELEDDEDEFE